MLELSAPPRPRLLLLLAGSLYRLLPLLLPCWVFFSLLAGSVSKLLFQFRLREMSQLGGYGTTEDIAPATLLLVLSPLRLVAEFNWLLLPGWLLRRLLRW